MVRSPCCEKNGLKKGPWTPEEDQKLLSYIEQHGHGSWQALPAKAGLQRCGKSCRLRWTNYLRPDIKRGKFSLQEEKTIIQLHALLGNKWSAIATHLPKRTDNEIKNYWNTHLKKRLERMGIDPVTHKPKANAFGSGFGHVKDVANLSHMAQWESARLEAEARLVRESKLSSKPLPNKLGFLGPVSEEARNLLPQFSLSKFGGVGPQTRPKCLDVLKAWQGMVSDMFYSACDTLESPTSTLSFADNSLSMTTNIAGIQDNSITCLQFGNTSHVKAEEKRIEDHDNSENEWKCFEKSNGVHDISSTYDQNSDQGYVDNAWILDTFRAPNENATIDGALSDILVYNSADHLHNSSSSNVSEEQVVTETSGANNNNNNLEDQGNYWSSLLNLVDTPASGSPPAF